MKRPRMHHHSAPARHRSRYRALVPCLALLASGAPCAHAFQPPRSIIQPAGELATAAATGPAAGLVTSRSPDVLGEQLGLPPGTGLVVDAAAPDSAAARMGLRRNDVLVSLDGQPLGAPEQLLALVAAAGPDTPLVLDVRRRGKPLAIALRTPAARAPAVTEIEAIVPLVAAAAPAAVASPAAPPAPPPAPPAARPALTPPPGARRIGPDAVVLEDRDCRLKVYRDSDTHLAMCDARGWLVFNGPISTPEQRALIPRRVRDRVERLETMLDSVVVPPPVAGTPPVAPPVTPPVAAVPHAGTAPVAVPAAPVAAPAAVPAAAVPPAAASEEPVAEIGRLDVPPIEIR